MTRKHRERETADDAELRRQIARTLGREPFLGQCSIHPDGSFELPRALVLFPEGAAGSIQIAVDERVVFLRGNVATVAQKELAGKLAALVPGCGAVINELRVAR
jgi:hypothetical protein